MKKVLLIASDLALGDATGFDSLGILQLFSEIGAKVFCYAVHADQAFEEYLVDINEVRNLISDEEVVLIYSHGIAFPEGLDLLSRAKCKHRIMRYHNVTPPHFFERKSTEFFEKCFQGSLQTPVVARLCNYHWCDSAYNVIDIVSAGIDFYNIDVVRLFHKISDFDETEENQGLKSELQTDSRVKLLFCGRVAPNKGHDSLLKTIATYCELYDENIVLNIVGDYDQFPVYYQGLLGKVSELKLESQVRFHGQVSFQKIVTHYKNCDLFLVMSEHEGFCVPIIEAAYCGKPIIAHRCGGMVEAAGSDQILLDGLDPSLYASAIRRVMTHKEEYDFLSKNAKEYTSKHFSLDVISSRLRSVIQKAKLLD